MRRAKSERDVKEAAVEKVRAAEREKAEAEERAAAASRAAAAEAAEKAKADAVAKADAEAKAKAKAEEQAKAADAKRKAEASTDDSVPRKGQKRSDGGDGSGKQAGARGEAPSDAVLKTTCRSIIAGSALEDLTSKTVRARIEKQLSLPAGALDARKKEVNAIIESVLQEADEGDGSATAYAADAPPVTVYVECADKEVRSAVLKRKQYGAVGSLA